MPGPTRIEVNNVRAILRDKKATDRERALARLVLAILELVPAPNLGRQ